NGDDSGSIAVVDRNGKKKTLTADYTSAQGLAWTTDGESVWFTAAKSGSSRALYAVSLAGRLRPLFAAPGALTLEDIARDGRALPDGHWPAATDHTRQHQSSMGGMAS